MMTDFPLVYKKLLPFGSPPMILETPLSTCGRLANTVSKREKRHSFSLGGGKRKTVGIECNLLLRPSREAAGGSSQPPDQGTRLGLETRERPGRFPGQLADPEKTGATFFRIGGGIVRLSPPRLSSPIQISGPLPREARHLILSKGSAGRLGLTETGPEGSRSSSSASSTGHGRQSHVPAVPRPI